MVNMLILFDQITDEGPESDLKSAPLHVPGSDSTNLPGDGDVDLSEEEMEQSVFGQESSLIPAMTQP